jgi:hypothetical protein
MAKKSSVSSDMIDEIVDEIVGELKSEGRASTGGGRTMQTTLPASQVGVIKSELKGLKNAWEIGHIESLRNATEKVEELRETLGSEIARVEGQIDELRTALIRLSGEIRKLKESRL